VRFLEMTSGFHRLVFGPVVYTTMNGDKSNGFRCIGKKNSLIDSRLTREYAQEYE
jgi:hypothetical protein